MLRYGIVTNIDEKMCRARVQFGSDELTSYWLAILQAKTQNDKFYFMPDIGEHVACLMDERSEAGVILGAIYSDMDKVPVVSKDKFKIKFQDGAEIEYDRKENELNLICQNINITGMINHTGVLFNSAGIFSEAEITDHTSSMQTMRSIYNGHDHIGNEGSPTSVPNQEMS
jgi:phage baseplate assembly protein V